MGLRYFWDSYAVIESINGNPNYAKYVQEPIVLTVFNLAEIYWFAINEYGEERSEEIYEKYKGAVIKINDETLKEAIRFRKKNKSKNLSYTDCIGYVYALRNKLIFLTGDKEFNGMSGVEFAK